MSTADSVKLAKLLISESFGPVVESVASVLIRRGRSNLRELIQHTCQKPKLVKDSLFVLIQHNLVLYRSSIKLDREETFYEINLKNVLNRVYLPHSLKLVKNHFGDLGLYVMDVILLYGKCKWSDIKDYFESDTDSIKDESDKDKELENLKNTFVKMVESRLLKAVQLSDMVSAAEKLVVAEENRIRDSRVPLMSTDIKKIRQELKNRQDNENSSEVIVGIKRARPQDKGDIEADVFFALNYAQLFVLIRQEVILDLTAEMTNIHAAEVVKTIIENSSKQIVSCSTPNSETVALYTVTQNFTTNPEFGDSISFGPDSAEKPKGASTISHYVDMLQNYQFGILNKNDKGHVFINYTKLNRHLKIKLLEKFVKNQFGSNTLRVFRCLTNGLKIEEKQIIKECLMQAKDCRQHLEVLSINGLIQLQEVPRTADRSASRCFYLWGFNLEASCRSLSQMIYKSLASFEQLRKVEKSKRHLLLNKLERKDVQSDDNLLTEFDKQQRALWIKIQDRLDWAQLKLSTLLAALENFE